MAEVLKALFCCFGPALMYQLGKTIRKRMEERDERATIIEAEEETWRIKREWQRRIYLCLL